MQSRSTTGRQYGVGVCPRPSSTPRTDRSATAGDVWLRRVGHAPRSGIPMATARQGDGPSDVTDVPPGAGSRHFPLPWTRRNRPWVLHQGRNMSWRPRVWTPASLWTTLGAMRMTPHRTGSGASIPHGRRESDDRTGLHRESRIESPRTDASATAREARRTQAESLARPLRRRAARMERPARELMR